MKLLHIVFILCAVVLICVEGKSKESGSKESGSKESGSKESGSKESESNESGSEENSNESEEKVEFPFLVFLSGSGDNGTNSTEGEEGEVRCFGVLIHAEWVLTTASCVQDVTTFEVRLGSNYPDSGGEVVTSVEVVIHLYFNMTLSEHDIALVKLPEPVVQDKNVQIIRLRQRSKACSKANNVVVIGVSGSLEDIKLTSEKLDLLATKDCYKTFDFEDFPPTISCGKAKKRENMCYGSSSPLVTIGNHAELVALSVETVPVCDVTETTRFTILSMYEEWMNIIMEVEVESSNSSE